MRMGPEHLRICQERLITRNVSWSTFNQAVCALRFLYQVTLGRPEAIRHLPFAKRPRIVPTVLSPEEVVRFLEAALPGRDRMLLDVIYSCGLRLKEALGLQVGDIDSARMVLRIRGKGQKERLAPLSPRLLAQLSEERWPGWMAWHHLKGLMSNLKWNTGRLTLKIAITIQAIESGKILNPHTLQEYSFTKMGKTMKS